MMLVPENLVLNHLVDIFLYSHHLSFFKEKFYPDHSGEFKDQGLMFDKLELKGVSPSWPQHCSCLCRKSKILTIELFLRFCSLFFYFVCFCS